MLQCFCIRGLKMVFLHEHSRARAPFYLVRDNVCLQGMQ